MGLKAWLGNRAGAGGFGRQFARSTVENGLHFGMLLYQGVGVKSGRHGTIVFDSDDELTRAGYELVRVPYSQASSGVTGSLLTNLKVAGVSVATKMALPASSIYLSRMHCEDFDRSLGTSTREMLSALDANISFESVLSYLKLPAPTNVTQVVSLDRPGDRDLFQSFLSEVGRTEQSGIAFVRGGEFGFGYTLRELARDTVAGVQKAAQEFSWT